MRRSPRVWTRESIEQSFRAFHHKHGRAPKHSDLGSHGLPWARTVERLYGGKFNAAVEAAGLTPRPEGRPRKRRVVGRAA